MCIRVVMCNWFSDRVCNSSVGDRGPAEGAAGEEIENLAGWIVNGQLIISGPELYKHAVLLNPLDILNIGI